MLTNTPRHSQIYIPTFSLTPSYTQDTHIIIIIIIIIIIMMMIIIIIIIIAFI